MPEWGFLEKKSYSPLYNMYCKRTFDTRIVFFPVQFSGQFVHVYIALKTESSAINISKKKMRVVTKKYVIVSVRREK